LHIISALVFIMETECFLFGTIEMFK